MQMLMYSIFIPVVFQLSLFLFSIFFLFCSMAWFPLFCLPHHLSILPQLLCYLIPPSILLRRRQWQPTLVLLPGKSHGWRSLVGCSPWGRKSRTRLSDFTFTFHFHALEEEMQPTPVFLPGESQGRQGLVGCHLWGCTESDTTEATQQQQQYTFNFSYFIVQFCSLVLVSAS